MGRLPGGNIGYGLMFGDKAATEAAFAKAAHTVSVRLKNNRLVGQLDGAARRARRIRPRQRELPLYTSTQNPHGVRNEMSHIFHLPETRFRVVAPDVGGGFGMKSEAYPEDALVLWASRRCGRPVKWTATRSESLIGDAHGRDQVVFGELALDENGKILALRSQARNAVGSYLTGPGLVALGVRAALPAERLRHPDAAHHDAGRVHPHLAARALSRGRPAGGDLPDRAAARPRRAKRSASTRWRSAAAT